MFGALFGEKKASKKQEAGGQDPKSLIEEVLKELLEISGWQLSFQIQREAKKEESLKLDIFGEDDGLLKARGGRLLLAIQAYLFRALRKKIPDKKVYLLVDSSGFWEESQKQLLSLADSLMEKARKDGQTVSLSQPLSPRQRRLVHERAAESGGIRSVSVGSGFYKTMRLSPASRQKADRK